MTDFRTAYCSAQCLLLRCDPYSPGDVLRVYHLEGGERPTDTEHDRFVVSRNVYFPTEFAVTLPLALFPFSLAEGLWSIFTASSFIVASYLMWTFGADHAPELTGWLICFLLVNGEQVLLYGNPVGLAVSLCVIAVWCFLHEKFAPIGILCLAASLALKPHDAGLVWFYFLLVPGAYRRRALQTIVVLAALSLPIIFWLTHVVPNWISDMHSNWLAFSVRGGIDDPSPAGLMNHGTAPITDLQSVFSVFRDDPHFYNFATYVVCAPMLLLWIFATMRARSDQKTAWFALAAIAPISMLFTYHRIYDAKLIMLAIPACAMVWAEGKRIGRIALVITALGVALTGDLPWSTYLEILIHLNLLSSSPPGPLVGAMLNFPLPLALLATGAFYLWVYAQHVSEQVALEKQSIETTTL